MARPLPRHLRLFGVTLVAIFVAELGDKTQLTTLAFSANTPGYRWIVFAASASALVLTALAGVLLGDLLARAVSPRTINVAAGIIFLVCAALFAMRFFLDAGAPSAQAADPVPGGDRSPWEAFALAFAAVFVAELGDKTQLATLSLAAGNRRARWVVFAGSSVALVAAAALACLVGGLVGRHLQSRYLTLAAAVVFAGLGAAFLLGRAEKGRREFAWLVREIQKTYRDEQCRRCPRFMRFLEHIRAIGSETVSETVDQLLLPADQQERTECDRRCVIDTLHQRWHRKFEHDDDGPLEKG